MAQQRQGQQVLPPSKRVFRLRVGILVFAIFLTIISVVIAVRTPGSFAANVSLALTAFGVVLGLFQLLIPLPGAPALVGPASKPTTLSATNEEYEILVKQIEKNHKSGDRGALVIFTRKFLVGRQVRIVAAEISNAEHRTLVAYRTINRRTIYVAVFENLLPDIYHVSIMGEGMSSEREAYSTVIAVLPGQVAELNWHGKLFVFFHF